MHKYAATGRRKEFCYKVTSNEVAGMCTTWCMEIPTKNGKTTKLPECGEVLLCKGNLDFRVVVHEVSHAMYGIKRRRSIGDMRLDKEGKIDATDEEWCVDAVGQMTATVYETLYREGLI